MGLAAFNRRRRELATAKVKEQAGNKADKSEKPKRGLKGGEGHAGE